MKNVLILATMQTILGTIIDNPKKKTTIKKVKDFKKGWYKHHRPENGFAHCENKKTKSCRWDFGCVLVVSWHNSCKDKHSL